MIAGEGPTGPDPMTTHLQETETMTIDEYYDLLAEYEEAVHDHS